MNRPLAGLAALMVFSAACESPRDGLDRSAATTTALPVTTTLPTTSTTQPPAPPTTVPPAPATLRRGDSGPEVRRIQDQLVALRYWMGAVDGVFGQLTEQAVFAFQKVQGLARDGAVGPGVRSALDSTELFQPQSSSGLVWEVDKARQILVEVRDGAPVWIWNTSTGTEKPYEHDGREHLADTPPGRYTFTWQVDGVRDGELGPLYRPKYFHRDGLAIHGYARIPPQPASHGCVRLSFAAMDFIWATGEAPLGVPLWVY